MKNDPRHVAVHEAGHAVIGRRMGMACGYATIAADHDSAGHSITADPHAIAYQWEEVGRFRDMRTVWIGRIITLMAGAEAESELLGRCEGGDGDDREQVDLMLAELCNQHDRLPAIEIRLRKATRMLIRRHRGMVDRVANELTRAGTISEHRSGLANSDSGISGKPA